MVIRSFCSVSWSRYLAEGGDMDKPDLDIFTGILQTHTYNSHDVEEHVDTVNLERDGDSFHGIIVSEICYGTEPFKSSRAPIEGRFNRDNGQLELRFSWSKWHDGILVLKADGDRIMGCMDKQGLRWDSWSRKLFKQVNFI